MKLINGAEVCGDDGSKVKYNQRRVSYKKDNHAASISAEFVLDPVTLLIYIDTLNSWYPPHEKEMMSDMQKNEIIDAIKQALTLLNVKYEIVSEKNNSDLY